MFSLILVYRVNIWSLGIWSELFKVIKNLGRIWVIKVGIFIFIKSSLEVKDGLG